MNGIIHTSYDSFRFGSPYRLKPDHLKEMIKIFNSPGRDVDAALGGRTSVSVIALEGIGSVLVKTYTRGGLIRHAVKNTYMRLGKLRCRTEFEQMQKAREAGIRVPEPVAYAYQGRLFYRAWLITKEIKDAQSLVNLSFTDAGRARTVMEKYISQFSKLVQHKIYHADLHPGNVLVDNSDRVFIIDFDKARRFRGSKKRLRARYLDRWKRAVVKHDLPVMLLDALRDVT